MWKPYHAWYYYTILYSTGGGQLTDWPRSLLVLLANNSEQGIYTAGIFCVLFFLLQNTRQFYFVIFLLLLLKAMWSEWSCWWFSFLAQKRKDSCRREKLFCEIKSCRFGEKEISAHVIWEEEFCARHWLCGSCAIPRPGKCWHRRQKDEICIRNVVAIKVDERHWSNHLCRAVWTTPAVQKKTNQKLSNTDAAHSFCLWNFNWIFLSEMNILRGNQ